jgi:hypothetical protein
MYATARCGENIFSLTGNYDLIYAINCAQGYPQKIYDKSYKSLNNA